MILSLGKGVWFTSLVSLLTTTTNSRPLKSTTQCPCDQDTWSKRAKEFQCQADLNYTCILNDEDELMEACVIPYVFDRDAMGCPYLVQGSGMFGTHTEVQFSPCGKSDCPLDNHVTYTVSELYKYKRCWIQEKDRNTMFGDEKTLEMKVCLPVSQSNFNNIFTLPTKVENYTEPWNSTYMNAMNTTVSAKEKTPFWFGFVLWVSGAMLMLLPMSGVLTIHKIRKKYKPCNTDEDGKKKRSKRKKRRKFKKKNTSDDKSSSKLIE